MLETTISTPDQDMQTFLAALPLDGSMISNITLQRKLSWDKERYWATRNRLKDDGQVRTAKGRGGLTGRIVSAPFEAQEVVPERERELYSPLMEVLKSDAWIQDWEVGSQFVVEDTSTQGRRDTGGGWTRPDLVIVSVKSFKYFPEKQLDIWTFEVKKSPCITAVYEAAAHGRFATLPFVMFPYLGETGDDLEEIVEECKRLNIGLITFSEAANYESWNVRWEPIRRSPAPSRMEDFISRQLTHDSQNKIICWTR